jgi:hypothetical protein
MKTIFLNLFLLTVLTFALAVDAKSQTARCKVTDPTGTPLNVRASPNGRILRKIKNNTVVYVEQYSTDSKGRPWAQISLPTSNGRKILGWVFREFISCY